MMDDHAALSAARNELIDALQELSKPGIMGAADFRASRKHTVAALALQDALLLPKEAAPCALPDDWGTRLLGLMLRPFALFGR
jgi:hypothetical protein